MTPCATIQYAIDQADPNDVIDVKAGTYAESVTISKSITILGPNAETSPNAASLPAANARVAEAIIQPPAVDGVNAVKIASGAKNVTISGTTVDLTNSSVYVDAATTPKGQAYVTASNSQSDWTLTLTNNIFKNGGWANAGSIYIDNSGTNATVTVEDNRFVGAREATNGLSIWNSRSISASVKNNVWLNNMYSAGNFSTGTASGSHWDIADNWIGNSAGEMDGTDHSYEIQSGFLLSGKYDDLTMSHNYFKDIEAFAFYLAYGFSGAADISDNTIDGYHGEIDPGYAAGGWGVVTAVTSSGSATTDLSGVTFKHNNLSGLGTSEAIHLAPNTTGDFDAQENYWDRAEGPRVSQISSASGQSVTYDPWCLDATCTDVHDTTTTTIATPGNHPGWGNDPDPATSGAPAYVTDAGRGALNLVGSPAVDYYHPVSLPLGEVNQLSFDQKTVAAASDPLTVQIRIVGARSASNVPQTAPNGFASLVWTMPTPASTDWDTQALDLTTAKFQSTKAINGLASWDGTGMTLGDIARNNPEATVTMYGVFRGSTNASPIADDGSQNVLVDKISFNRALTNFELDSANPSVTTRTSRPSSRDGWTADNAGPTYVTGPAGATGSGSLNVSIEASGPRNHVDYFHSVDPTATGFDMHNQPTNLTTVPLVGVQGLGFKFYVAPGSAYPSYQLRIIGANTGTTTGYTALNWEPAYNGPAPATGTWVTLSDLENGKWWSTKAIKGLPTPQGSTATLAQIAFENPNAVIVAYGVNLGSGPGASTAYVDDVTFAGTKTDFEPDVVNPGGNTGGPSGNGGAGGGGGAPADDGIEVLGVTDRISGDNRYETAAVIAETFGTADAVVIANGSTQKDGVDALAANYLAGRVGAPILLTEATTAPPSLLASVKGVLTGSASPTIYVMGKTDSVSDKVVAAVTAAAKTVTTGTVKVVRVGGDSRYQTSALAAQTAGEVQPVAIKAGGATAKTAILTSGTVNADPLSAGPISYAMGIPVLLTNGTTLDPKVAAAIQQLGITQLLVLGGAERVSPAVLSATGIPAADTVRIAGGNRYATSAALYTFALQIMGYHEGEDTDTYLGNAGGGFPDVLTSGPLAGKGGAAVLTVGDGNSLDAAVKAYLQNHSTPNVTALGGTERVSVAQLTEARTLAGGA